MARTASHCDRDPTFTHGDSTRALTLADIAKIAEFAASLGNVERVDVLPFHQMGKFKYERLGIPYALADREVPTQELVDRAIAVYRAKGLTAY